MATFPVLRTGAVAQYPAVREERFQNQAVRFVDGSEQRYRDSAGALRRWEIALDLLDEEELRAVEAFFEEVQGAFGIFTFVDPWDAVEYPNCSLESDELEIVLGGEMRGGAVLVVTEGRSF